MRPRTSSTLATFALDVANGNYDVTVTLGDSVQAHDQMGVFLEGLQVDSVTTAKGEFSTKTYTASVGDGPASGNFVVLTMPFKVIDQLIKHPLTDIGLERFLADWKKTNRK